MIAFLINELNIRGGTHKQFLKLLEYTESQQIDFFVVTKEVDYEKTYPGFSKFADRIKVLPVKTEEQSFLSKIISCPGNIYRLRKAIKAASIINIHDNGFEKLLPAFIGKKVIWQVNDLPPHFNPRYITKSKSITQTLVEWYIMLCQYFFIDVYTVNVTKNADRIYRCFRRKAQVFYCGIESVNIERTVEESLRRFELGKVNLLSSGVFLSYRNYETQVRIVKQLISKGVNTHLNIIGATNHNNNDNYYQQIKSLIEKEHLDEHITICGMVDETKFKELHKDADIFLFINIDQSWGLAVFEAMSCGIPVIVSNSVGATEILKDGRDAIFVNPVDYCDIANKIQDLMHNTSKYIALSTASRQFCSRYTWENAYCSKILNLLLSKIL
jgi:glycosyltransferase involved in cell wall biosynthesis